MALEHLSPSLLWKHFEKLCSIPRPSGHERQAAAYVVSEAQRLGLESYTDAIGNVIVRKEASPGFENRGGVILQSHLDMVPQKNEGTDHDFLKDPINPYIDGEWVKARGTTLGADNGIGVAAALAVLEDKELRHGPLEALFTIDEESGMTGALNLQPGVLEGKTLINLDTEHEGEIFIGCAGGIDAQIKLPVSYENAASEMVPLGIAVKGLKGGHSGIDIDLGRGNAIKILTRFLYISLSRFDFRICSIRGGSVRNAIPREAFCSVMLPREQVDSFCNSSEQFELVVKSELSLSDPGVSVVMSSAVESLPVLTSKSQLALLRSLYACPNGVIRMSDRVIGVVETSSNLAIIKNHDDYIEVQCLLRSSIDTARDDLCCAVESAFESNGASVAFTGAYPGWIPDPEASVLKVMKRVYAALFGEEPEIKVVHAGLECGIIGAKYPQMELVSIGPTMRSPHSPDECLQIDTVDKFWRFLVGTLKEV